MAPGAGAGWPGCWRARQSRGIYADTDGTSRAIAFADARINLDTHILDVVNEMKWQQLNDVVLVGHSYAGLVISGVAEKMEKSIASFVLLDAFFPETGQGLGRSGAAGGARDVLAAARDGAAGISPRSAAMFNVNERDRAWVDAQCTPQPVKCGLQKVTLTGARERIATKSLYPRHGLSERAVRSGTGKSPRQGLAQLRGGVRP